MSASNILQKQIRLLSGVLLLSICFAAGADNLEEANKLFKQAQYSQALDKLNEALSKNPKDAQTRFLKGLVLAQQGKTEDAAKVFSALTNDYPELPEPYNNLAVLYANQGQYEKAKQALEMAIRTHPSYAIAHENLGDVYAKMASLAYDRALKLDNGNSTTQTKLAMIQDLFGETVRKPNPLAITTSPPPSVFATKSGTAATLPDKPSASVIAHTTDPSKELLKTVHDWAAAWSSKNVSKYLSYYAADFKVPKGVSRSDWEAERKARINKPQAIHVAVNNPTISIKDEDHASVEFRQSYSAGAFKATSGKTLLMEKSGGKWLIQEERVK